MEIVNACDLGSGSPDQLKRLIIVGSFPPLENKIIGGVATSCKLLLNSDLSQYCTIETIDSTQKSNPPPNVIFRIWPSFCRIFLLVWKLLVDRPDALLLFASSGASFFEKGLMSRLATVFSVQVLFFPRSGRVLQDCAKNRIFLWATKFFCRSVDVFICQGTAWQNFAINVLEIPQTRTRIVPNWSATQDLLAIGTNRNLFDGSHQLRILFVGWLEAFKGVNHLLNAICKLQKEIPVQLTIAGKGNFEAAARSLVEEYGIDDIVDFAGWVTGDAKLDLYKNHNVFVLPSEREGMPNALIEAASAGLVTISTDVGNISDYFQAGRNTFNIEVNNPDSIVGALKAIWTSKDLASQIALQGHADAQAHFSLDRAVKEIVDMMNCE